MKKKKKNEKTGKMRETKRARVKNAPSAERRERLSLTLSARKIGSRARDKRLSLYSHTNLRRRVLFWVWRGRFSSSSSDQKRETKTTGRQRRRTNDAALLCSLKTFESKCDDICCAEDDDDDDATRERRPREIRV